jgi:hypothetical protein
MNPEHWRRPQIIRLPAAAGLSVFAAGAARVEAQGASCVPCLVIGIAGAGLEAAGLALESDAPADPDALRDARFVVVRLDGGRGTLAARITLCRGF